MIRMVPFVAFGLQHSHYSDYVLIIRIVFFGLHYLNLPYQYQTRTYGQWRKWL